MAEADDSCDAISIAACIDYCADEYDCGTYNCV
uniref:Uncharacterized protein n=1 Tax=Acrobeloides nanus TaxID=290746 RepID=A0A914CY75_9BILA